MPIYSYNVIDGDRLRPFYSTVDAGLAYNYFATDFNGTDESANAGNTIGNFEYNDPFSVSAWIKTSDTTADIRPILSRISSDRGWHFSLYSGKARLSLANTTTTYECAVETTSSVATGGWKHVVITYDGTYLASGMTCYIGGSSDTPSTLVDTLSTNTTVGTRDMLLGKATVSAADKYFEGLVGEIALFDKELSGAEVTELFGPGEPTNPRDMSIAGNILALWRMGDGGTDTIIPSEISAGGDATLSNMDSSNYVSY